jgi:hypothetical protein
MSKLANTAVMLSQVTLESLRNDGPDSGDRGAASVRVYVRGHMKRQTVADDNATTSLDVFRPRHLVHSSGHFVSPRSCLASTSGLSEGLQAIPSLRAEPVLGRHTTDHGPLRILARAQAH